MLQSKMQSNEMSRTLMKGGYAQEAQAGGLSDIISFVVGFLRRRYLIMLTAIAVALALGVVYLKTTPPTFTGQVKVLFGNSKAQFVQQQSLLAETPLDVTQIETQLQILKSKRIATSVIDQLKLADDPEFNRRPLFAGLLQSITGSSTDELPAESKEVRLDALIADFGSRMQVSRVGYSNVIEISFSSSNPKQAATIANAIAATYIHEQVGAKLDNNRVATTWLQDRLRELGEQALNAEQALNTFRAKNNIVASSGKLIDDQQISELSSRMVAARGQTAEAQARLNRIETILNRNSADTIAIGNLDASGSDALSNPIINNLRQQYLELSRRETEWSSRFGKDHQAVVSLRSRMRAIRTSILDEVRRLAETSRSDFEVAKQRQLEIERQMTQTVTQSRTTNSAEATGRDLENTAKGYRSLHESFLQRYMGSVQQESFPISDARIISPASPPQNKTKPKAILVLAISLMGGVISGAGLALMREFMDRAFRTAAQAETTLDLPCLSLIPLIDDTGDRRFAQDQEHYENRPGSRTISRSYGGYWAATNAPLSRFSESIRAIKLAIDFNPTTTTNRIIGITSSLPNEGKSTIAASLAQLIALCGKRVIVVDCDFRNPSLSMNLAPDASVGIIDILLSTATLENAIWRDPKTGLNLLPVANSEQVLHTSELLSSDRTKRLFDKIRSMYDYVIVDLPPLVPIVDVRATTQFIDCYVLVIEWGKTKSEVVRHALHYAPNVYDATIGTVLNKTDMKAVRSYSYYLDDYYKNDHYLRYGVAN